MLVKEIKKETIILEEKDLNTLNDTLILLSNLINADYYLEANGLGTTTLQYVSDILYDVLHNPEVTY